MTVAIFWFGFAIAVGVWASNKGRTGFGWFLLACIISPLLAGIFLAVSKDLAIASIAARQAGPSDETHVRCPQCAEFVLPEAVKCKHCGAALTPVQDFSAAVIARRRQTDDTDSKNVALGVVFVLGLIILAVIISRF